MSKMDESPEFIRNIVDSLREKERDYKGGDHIYDSLANKSLVAILGPTGSGKSTTSDEVVRRDNEIALIDTTTTRSRRAEDPAGFKTDVSYAEFNDAVSNANLVNYNVIGQHIYGTFQSGFTRELNIGPVMSRSVDALMEAGFRRFDIAYMVTDGQTYEQRLRQERQHFSDFRARIIEGHRSLNFAEDNIDNSWMHAVESSPLPGGLQKAASKIIAIARAHSGEFMLDSRALHYIDDMRMALKRVAADL
jgi:ribose 1,5-bisphosphokinase PhnN